MEKILPTKANILIADDDVLIAESTKIILRKANYNTVGTAINATEAIQIAKEKHPDLILMDINLDNSKDGISAAEEIQKFADIPFVFVTAYSDNDTIERAKKIGPFGYFIKPYDNRELLVTIETSLYRHSFDKKIKEQELLFRTVSNYAYEWEYWQLPDLQFKYCSPSSIRTTGYKREEFIENPKLLIEIVHPEDKDSFEKHFNESNFGNRDKVVNALDFRIIDKQGSIKFIRHSCSPIYDEQNNYLGRRVTNVDITERKIAESALEDSEKRFRLLFENAPLSYQSLDIKGNLIDVNPTWLKTMGYDSEEVIGRHFTEFMTPDSASLVKQRFKHFLEAGEIHDYEFEMIRKDGSHIFVNYNGNIGYDELGNFKQTHCIFTDITERKQAVEALKESEEKYRKLVDDSPDAIAIYIDGKIVYVNNTSVSLMKASSAVELIGMPIIQFVHPDYRGLVTKRIMDAMKSKKALPLADEKFIRLDGSEVDVEVKAIPIIYEKKPAIQIIVRDITVRKQTEEALYKSEQKFRSIFENHSAVKLLIEPDTGKIVDANKAAANYYGWSIEELKQMKIQQINTLPLEQVLEIMQRTKNQQQGHYEFQHRLKNGTIRDVDVFSSKIEISGKTFLHLINHDITERKKAEEALRVSNLRYEKLFTKAEDGILILSEKGKIISVNESFAKMHGYTIDEMLEMDIRDLDIPETAKLLNERLAHILSGGAMKFESGHYHKDGHIILLEVTTSRITLGNEILIQAFHRDITARIAKDEELRKLNEAIIQSPVSIVITNLDSKIEYVNPKYTKVTGYTFEEAYGQNPRVLKSGETPAEEYSKMWAKLASGVMWTGVFHNKKKNGKLFWESANISPIKNNRNEITHYVAVKEDITDKVEKENELRKYREHLEELVKEKTFEVTKQNIFFRTLIDTIPNPIFVEDTNLRFTEVNKAFEEFFNISRNEVLGKRIQDYAPKASTLAKKYDKQLLIKHDTAVYESIVPNKENGITPVLIYKSSFGLPGKNPEGITALIIDISKQKEMEETTLEALQKEKELNEMKTSFISMASHEFRTPLTTILSSADLLKKYYKKWEEKKNIAHFQKIQDSVQYITSMLDEVLTISRSDKGKIDFNPSVVDLNDFGIKIIEQIKSQATPHHNLIYNYNFPYQNVIVDSKLLDHILNNLLTNAIKYSPEGGDVILTVDDDNEFIKFTIKDNGIGIPEEDKNKLFEPFFRGENSGDIKGTGLGLNIVKRYVDIHHGELSLESKLGEGSKFFVKIKKVY